MEMVEEIELVNDGLRPIAVFEANSKAVVQSTPVSASAWHPWPRATRSLRLKPWPNCADTQDDSHEIGALGWPGMPSVIHATFGLLPGKAITLLSQATENQRSTRRSH